jgi:hypothetical protein
LCTVEEVEVANATESDPTVVGEATGVPHPAGSDLRDDELVGRDASAAERHALVGRHRYRASVWVERTDNADGVDDVDLVEEWFDDLSVAGGWVDARAGEFDGQVDQYVWAETVTIDGDTVVYDAAPVETGRFVDRVWMTTASEGPAQAMWSHMWEPDADSSVFDDASLASLDGFDGEWELDASTLAARAAGVSAVDLAESHRLLVEALRVAWRVCETAEHHRSAPASGLAGGVRAGVNVPELLSGALEVVAAEVGGPDMLVKHRPGSWEAEHVHALGQVWRFCHVS